ncbi:hypothetical protein HDU91_001630, partial [Kappamyces sp. JEL0680]
YTADQKSSILVGSPRDGDVVAIEMDATRDIVFRRESFLFASTEVKLSVSPTDFGLSNGGLNFSLASGYSGTLGLSKRGCRMAQLPLDFGQEVLVHPANIVAWDAAMAYKATIPDKIAHTAWRQLEWMTDNHIPFRHAAEALVYYCSRMARFLYHFMRYRVLGKKGMLKFSGPGHIIVSSARYTSRVF